jgi:hypothetical protein
MVELPGIPEDMADVFALWYADSRCHLVLIHSIVVSSVEALSFSNGCCLVPASRYHHGTPAEFCIP